MILPGDGVRISVAIDAMKAEIVNQLAPLIDERKQALIKMVDKAVTEFDLERECAPVIDELLRAHVRRIVDRQMGFAADGVRREIEGKVRAAMVKELLSEGES